MRFKDCAARVKATDGGEADGDAGTFEAIVSVFGNVDSMGDMVMPGAFTDTLAEWKASGDPIPLWWSHRMDDPAMNIGAVVDAAELEPGDPRIPDWADPHVAEHGGLWVKGRIDTGPDASDKAAATHRLLKSRRVTQFSYAYDETDAGYGKHDGVEVRELRKLKLYEVSPTPIGANELTELVTAKAARKVGMAPHSTDTTAAAWDAAANERRLPNDAGASTYGRAYAWRDPDGDPDTKAAYKFLHHLIDAEGHVGAAALAACSAGIGALNGARGGADIPDADKAAVYRHLAKHLRDGDMEPPELASGKATPATQAGEALSAKRESSIREAVALLTGVLAALDNGDAAEGEPAKREEPDGAKREEPVPHDASPSLVRLQLDLAELEVQVA